MVKKLSNEPPAVIQPRPAARARWDVDAAEQAEMPLAHYLWILKRSRWKILGFVLFCVAATLIVSSRLTPVYEATATIDIDRQTAAGVIGQEALRASISDADQFLATQVKLIQSDSVLRPVAQKYGLRELEDQEEKPRSEISEEAPILLKKLKVARPPNTYLVLVSYRSADPRLAADVANAVANSYIEHTYRIRFRSSAGLSAFMERQLEELKAKMERSVGALIQFERELNVVNPEEKTSILSARLLQLNTEYTNAQADRVRKEAAHNSVAGGLLEAAQVSGQGEALRKLSERLHEAQEKFAAVKLQFGPRYPEYKKAAAELQEVERLIDDARENTGRRVEIEYRQALNREEMLRQSLSETKNEFDRLNAKSIEYQALKREAEADKKLYEELVRRIKEAGINSAFQNSSIRLADPARPPRKPVFPKTTLSVLLAFLLSGIVSLAVVAVADSLDNTIRDPEQVSRALKTDVIGSLPVVKPWRGRIASLSREGDNGALVLLNDAPDTVLTSYAEAIRTLRNSILLADFDRRIRSLLITSASPGEGKSTIAAHLAAAHAQQGHRTLLIDGDLRRPSVHRRFGIPGTIGLSNAVVDHAGWRQALVTLETLPALDILPAGSASRRAAELVGSGLLEILDEASQCYDLIILDAPPLLGFAEPLQMATAVDGVIIVARAGETNRKGVASALETLARLRASVVGVVLNEVHKGLSDSYSYYGYYHTYYQQHLPG